MQDEYVAHEETYKGFSIKIIQDTDAQNPRTEYDNVGTMVCWHSRYDLGDVNGQKEHGSGDDFFGSLSDARLDELEERHHNDEYQYKYRGRWRTEAQFKAMQREYIEANYVLLPLYLYDHSGITISTGPFSCPGDSGQIGWIYASKERCISEWGKKEWLESGTKYLRGEVKTYDDFLTGNVYGYVVGNDEDDHLDSCWGFYPNHDDNTGYAYCLSEARESVDYLEEKQRHDQLHPSQELDTE